MSSFKIFILITVLVFLISINLYSAMAGNESHGAYGESGQSERVEFPSCVDNTNLSIKYLIALGASHFFKSNSKMDEFSNYIELMEISEVDFSVLRKTINRAIYNMEKARDTYFTLKRLANITPYNYKIIDKLVSFDYENFKKEKKLLPSIFNKVKFFLSSGDVTEIYNEFYIITGEILNLLYTIRQEVNENMFPSLPKLWVINQKYSEFKLFGQYVTQVFYGIK